ncbi:hypothetical protein VOLCADRAFT_90520 [Volvox carteri f. nagariensis]|uniref:VASt domain-containing protein n=1 Tax=Volvox carteri f. nagariensis TaxID=3068 RepID=D8TUL6_VOLCA|nr:uncharacterized protein VOLCADRAFT_90520 [Volvox carteri f. nagariensis]EFJ48846.1 hypothetical protein VOLCADRAFT_90520 [Volvox carteri f. nagariensis]|eukprot:XP_002950178.1 hypothetical protein VOLCADRAFT_90520 [Volvox carteri f. nagariensis]
MWEECLPFPLDHVTEDHSLILRVLDKDIGHFNSFLGTVSLPVREVLDNILMLDQEKVYRLPLLDRQNQSRKKGELQFGVAVVAKQKYKEMRGFISSLQDPDTVHNSLKDYCLHLKLHSLKELGERGGKRTADGGVLGAGMLSSLVIEVTVCSYTVRKPLSGQLVGGELDPEGVELAVPLGAAFRDGDVLKGKNRAQFGEVKVELLSGRTRLAKTQVPIWDVPVRPLTPPEAEAEGEGEEGNSGSNSDREEGQQQQEKCNSRVSALGAGLSLVSELAAAAAAAISGGRGSSEIGSAAPSPATLQQSTSRTSAAAKDDSQLPLPSPTKATPPGATPPAPPSPSTSASPLPLWCGKKYTRRMERLDRALNRSPVAVISMQLVKAEPGESYDGDSLAAGSVGAAAAAAGGAGGGVGDVFDGADVDSPAEPLAVPSFDGGLGVADFVVGVGPLALLKMVYGEGSELAERVGNVEKITGMKAGPWGPDPEGKALCMRDMSYMKPSPVGPVAVQSQQKIMIKHNGGFVVHQAVIPHVPSVGPCVRVLGQIVGQHVGPSRTRLIAAVKLEWFKSGMMVQMLKGKIEDGTPKDTRKYFDALKGELAAMYAVEGAATAAGAGGCSGAAVAAAASCGDSGRGGAATAAVTATTAVATSDGDGTISIVRLLQLASRSPPWVVAVLVCWLVTLVALVHLVGAVRQVREELAHSERALKGVFRALEALKEQVVAASVAVGDGAAKPPACVVP